MSMPVRTSSVHIWILDLLFQDPHVGHLYTSILGDVLKRWQVLKGDSKATLLTGTDEHGMKIQKAAAKANADVKAFCDHHAQSFRDLAQAANISYDRFIRTTDQDHRHAVEHFWNELNHRGYIYESNHQGWYSVSDETFYPESQVHLVLDPRTGRKMYASIETGKEVEWTSEMNYHFKLSAFREKLLEHYRANPDFIVPSHRMKFIVREVTDGLSDLSVSRPASRLSWGIPVPNDPSQTIYVWLDALINYLTMTGYPSIQSGNTDVWPPDCQVIGKDIVRFHCIYWPAFLMALDLPLTKQFLTHAHWTLNNEKMSKSLGNVVNPFYAMDRFGVDTIRFYMVHEGGIVDDARYENSFIVEKYKNLLQGGFGNLLSRVWGGKRWSVSESVKQFAGASKDEFDSQSRAHIEVIDGIATAAEDAMDRSNPREAAQIIMERTLQVRYCFKISDGTNFQADK